MAARKPEPRPADGNGEEGFEPSLERLEAIVEELEGGELTLEDSLKRYEEGIRLSRRLTRTLDAAEQRIERLVEGGDGEARTEPMELESRAEAPAPAARRAPSRTTSAPADDDTEEGRLPF